MRLRTLFVVVVLAGKLHAQIPGTIFEPYSSPVQSTNFIPFGNLRTKVEMADFDGDGKPDAAGVITAFNKGYIAVCKNKSVPGVLDSSSFEMPDTFYYGSTTAPKITSGDIDGDGKPDIITWVYEQAVYYSNSFSIYRNTSTIGNISFAAPVTYPAHLLSKVSLRDLDGDSKPEIIVESASSRICKNTSVPGTIAFDTINYITLGISAPAMEDMDGDGLIDLVGGNGSIRRNTTSGGIMSFAAAVSFITTTTMQDIATVGCGDIDGDGKRDYILAGAMNSGSIWFLRNTSSPGILSFDPYVKLFTGKLHGAVTFADLDNDGKEELMIGTSTTFPDLYNLRAYSYYGQQGSIDTNYLSTPKLIPFSGYWSISAMDLNGDGYKDLVVSGGTSNGGIARILKNNYSSFNGLLAWYTFSGNATDSSVFDHDGGGNASLTTDRFGNPNRAYSFTSNTHKVNADLFYGNKPFKKFSITVWIKPLPKLAAERNTIISMRTNNLSTSPETFAIYTHPNAPYYNKWTFKLTAFPAPGTSYELIGKTSKVDYAWAHIAATYDGDTMKIFINGMLDTSYVISIPKLLYGTQDLVIGNSYHTGTVTDGFTGNIDEVRIYDRELSPSEIATFAQDISVREYYSKSTGDLNLLSSWGTAPDGTGTAPLSFDSSNVAWYVVNNSNPTLSGNLNINGPGSWLVLGDGVNAFNLTVPAGNFVSCDSIYVNHNIIVTAMGYFSTQKIGTGTPTTVQYFSTTPQTIAAGNYDNLVAGLSTKSLTGNTVVRGTFSMMNTVDCSTHELQLGTSVLSRGTLNRSGGSINGKFTRWFSNAINSGTTGLFPVGTLTRYAPLQIEFTTAPTSGGKITVEFTPLNPGNAGLPLLDFTNGSILIDKAATDGYWKVTSSGISGGSFTNTATANTFTSVNDYTGLRMIRRNTGAAWTLQGTASVNSGSNTSVVVARTGLNTLAGEYGIGGDQAINPLPVKLVSFTAKIIDPATSLISWQTAMEVNAAKFVVQRSIDKSIWTTAGEVIAKGNSQVPVSYILQDQIIGITGALYYRLVQIDKDGRQQTEKTIRLETGTPEKVTTKLRIYPNPATDIVFVNGEFTEVRIFDMTGKEVKYVTQQGLVDIKELPSGIYYIKYDEQVLKLVKQ